MNPGLVRLARVVLPGVPLLLGWVVFGSAIVDDAHVTFAVAERLADTGRVANANGLPVEQSSSLLHVVLLGVLHRLLGVDVATLAWWLGGAAAAALVALTDRVVVHDLDGSPAAGVLAAAAVAVAPGVVLWSVGGLEATLAALALLGALRWWWRGADRVGAWGGLLGCGLGAALVALARPEGPMVLVAVTLGLASVVGWAAEGPPGPRVRAAVRSAAVPATGLLVGTGVVVAGRVVAFGAALPQPASTKGGVAIGRGWTYLWRRLVQDPGAELLLLGAVLVVLAAVARRRREPVVAVLGSGVVAVVAFVVLAGGDWMPGPRLLVPALAPAAALVAAAVPPTAVTAAVLVGAQVLGLGLQLRVDQVGVPVWYRDRVAAIADDVVPADTPWALRRSRIAVRDLALAPTLAQVVRDVATATGRPARVASFQAGLLAASLARTLGGDVELVDLARLTTRRFDGCEEVFVESIFGRVIDLRAWLAAGDPPCGVSAPPDVFFGLGDPGADHPLLADGWIVVARVVGRVPEGGRVAGRPLPAAQFVAVRPDLADVVLGGERVTIPVAP